jgi:hypothetical protein
VDALDVARFQLQGFVVLHAAIDPMPISAEVDRVGRTAFGQADGFRTLAQGSGTVTFRYAPMMCERTPVSIGLVDQCADLARELLGRDVVPGRAKATWYDGDTGWHRDSLHRITSVGVVTYFEPLHARTGALRIVPGSHIDPEQPIPERAIERSVALETEPGDVIVFDEHLIHGSIGGRRRRQWRVDFLVDPRDDDELAAASAWFDQSIPDERNDPGYDAASYPSYGHYWRSLDRPWTERLRELGVYERVRGRAES